MFLLLSNDDGYLAPGLRVMAELLRPQVSRLVVMAPDRNKSGASHSLTLNRPLAVHHHGDDIYSVDGTPSDCVHLAVTGYFDAVPDMVISGINRGANLGDDVMYSGTVAAAFAGRHLGLASLAVSNIAAHPRHYADSAQVVLDLLQKIRRYPLARGTLLNVNIPDLPYAAIRGIKTTVLGRRQPSGALVATDNPRGERFYWIGPSGAAHDFAPDSDFQAVEDGYVSVTPLQFDLTDHKNLDDTHRWLKETA